jgi:hypothetical protein
MICRHPGRSPLLALRLLCGQLAHGQTNVPVLPTPDIDALREGTVIAMLRLADGRIMVGGSFERLGSVSTSNGCGRLFSDGSVDAGFQCGANIPLEFLQDGSGRVYADGTGSQLVRLQADGSIDPSFTSPNASGGGIFSYAIVGGSIYLAGTFTAINGQPRSGLARIDLDGTLDPAWAPTADGFVGELHAASDGFLYLAGSFTQIDAQPRSGLARLSLPAASLDSWQPLLSGFGSSFPVSAMDSDGSHLYVSGAFSAVQGQARQQLAKIGLDNAATLDADWAPEILAAPTSSGLPLLRVIDDQVYLGAFSGDLSLRSGAPMATGRLLRVTRSGSATLDTAFDPFADVSGTTNNGPVTIISGDGGGRLFVGGFVSQLSQGELRLGMAALNADGSVDTLSALTEAGLVPSIGQPEVDDLTSATYVRGDFLKVNGVPRRGLIRLLPSGAIDSNFQPAPASYSAIALGNGALYAADADAALLRKLDPLSGESVPGHTPIGYQGSLSQILVEGDYAYLLGNFQLSGISPPLTGFARLDLLTETIDESFRFMPNSGGGISRLAIDPTSDSLFVAGSFSSLNGVMVSRLARIDGDTLQVDPAFLPVLSVTPSGLAADGNDGLWLHGSFSSINGLTCRGPARLLISTQGGLDPAFDCDRDFLGGGPLAFARDSVYVKGIDAINRFRRSDGGAADPDWHFASPPIQMDLSTHDDRLFAFGAFSEMGSEQRNSLAALPLVERFFGDGFE